MKIQFLYFSDCPNHLQARENLKTALKELEIENYKIEEIEIKTEEEAERFKFPGSPTIRVNGIDVDPNYKDMGQYALMCRVYRIGGKFFGAPTVEMIKSALQEAKFEENIKNIGCC